MTESQAKSLSVELDADAFQPIVSGLRSFGEAIVGRLKNGGGSPTVWDSFKNSIDEGWMIKGGGLEDEDLVPDWQWYTRVQTGCADNPEMLSPDSPEIFQRKIIAQIRNLLWGRMSLSIPWYFWESLGIAAWGGGAFKLLYADAIRSILRERYILSAEEREEVPSLSPNSFWLLLSLAPLGLSLPPPHEEVPRNYALRSCAYFPHKYLEYLRAEEQRLGVNPTDYMAVTEIRTVAKHQAQQECWATFWDQWFLGELFKQRGKTQNFGFIGLNRYLAELPILNSNRSELPIGESLEASISIPSDKLKETVPFWYTHNLEYV
jgi:hypothetical protein